MPPKQITLAELPQNHANYWHAYIDTQQLKRTHDHKYLRIYGQSYEHIQQLATFIKATPITHRKGSYVRVLKLPRPEDTSDEYLRGALEATYSHHNKTHTTFTHRYLRQLMGAIHDRFPKLDFPIVIHPRPYTEETHWPITLTRTIMKELDGEPQYKDSPLWSL